MTREALISLLIKEGFDTFTACKHADTCIAEFKASGRKKATYTMKGGAAFTLKEKKS